MTHEYPMIEIKMLGSFSMKLNGKEITSSPRTKKVWLLLEYLIYNRERYVALEDLVHLLWNQKECDSPASALKNLIYRGRQFLRALSADENIEFICFQDGRYFWNPECRCEIDCEQMEELYNQAQQGGSLSERLELLQRAMQLYQGNFLPLMDFSEWALSRRKYYENIYIHCITKIQELYQKERRYEEWIRLGEWAVKQYPWNEEIQCLLMQAYLDAGYRQKAIEHYHLIRRDFDNDLKLPKTKSLYAQMMAENHTVDFDFTALQEALRGSDSEVGAFFCSFDIFRNIYELQTRVLMREGRHLYIGLLSLSRPDGLDFGKDELHQVVEAVKETLVVGLRRGDVVSQYAENQFVMMLPLRDESYGKLVIERLKGNYQVHYPGQFVNWNVRFSRVEPSSDMNKEEND